MRTMRLSTGILALLLLPTTSPAAEDSKPQQSSPKITSRSELVLVPTLVRDKSGAHVAGLSKGDFALLENGAEREISVFEEIRTSGARPSRPSLPAGEFGNYLGNQPVPGRVTIILMDAINTKFSDRAYAREQILKFLQETASSKEPIALLLLHRGGVRVIHDFTTDPAVLAEAVRRFQLGPGTPVAQTEEEDPILSDETDQLSKAMQEMEGNILASERMLAAQLTLDGLEQICRAYAAIPGRKSVIWASGGFPFSVDDLSRGLAGSRFVTEIVRLYERTWHALNDADIAVYPVDVRGQVVLFPGGSRRMSGSPVNIQRSEQRAALKNQDTLDTFTEFADMTGGRAYFNTNDLAHAFHDAVDDSGSYYLLGFYLRPDDRKPGWRKLQVKVKPPHAQVRARSGFYVVPEDKDSNKTKLDEMALAMNSPLDFTSLPILGRWTDTTPKGEKKRATFELVLPANAVMVDESDQNHMSLDFAAAAREPTGKVVGNNGRSVEAHLKPESLAQIRSSGITYKGDLDLAPGKYIVRFVVRDNLSGRVGSVAAPLTVP